MINVKLMIFILVMLVLTAFANNARRADEAKMKRMTPVMMHKLRTVSLTIDMICSQPSCPVCSEDYAESSDATQLPCSHVFHATCVIPWLHAKRTCPICRFEITESVPSIEELEKFTEV